MTAAMDIRQTAHYMAVAICTLIVQAFLWLIGILWSVIREIVNGVFRVVVSVIVLMLSLITFFGLLLVYVRDIIFSICVRKDAIS